MSVPYRDQLRDIRWQRRRLERFEAAGWKCSACGCEKRQLHVHHKQYFRGRMAWDYGDEELDVLCEECHEAAGVRIEQIKEMLLWWPDSEMHSLLAGYNRYNDCVDSEIIIEGHKVDVDRFVDGFIARISRPLTQDDKARVISLILELLPPASEEAQIAACGFVL